MVSQARKIRNARAMKAAVEVVTSILRNRYPKELEHVSDDTLQEMCRLIHQTLPEKHTVPGVNTLGGGLNSGLDEAQEMMNFFNDVDPVQPVVSRTHWTQRVNIPDRASRSKEDLFFVFNEHASHVIDIITAKIVPTAIHQQWYQELMRECTEDLDGTWNGESCDG